MWVKEESEKAGLKFKIQKIKIMASDPITSRQIEGESGISDRFSFLWFKIMADGDRSHEIKRPLLLGNKVMTNLHSVLKSRHLFANKGLYRQSYGFYSSSLDVCVGL